MIVKYYAVKKGYHTGIFSTWPEAQKQVSGFSGAQYKSFSTPRAAENYMNGNPESVVQPVDSSEIMVYTDGGSRNTGNHKNDHVHQNDKSAWAYLIQYHGKQVDNAGFEWGATNNRMEIMALLSALQWLVDSKMQNEAITVISDSHYVLDSITKKWLWGWQKRNWKTASGSDVKNVELWQALLPVLARFKHLKFKWTKGHATNDGNVFVDKLLNQKMDEMGSDNGKSNQLTNHAVSKPLEPSKHLNHINARPKQLDKKTAASVMALSNGLKKLGIDVNIK